MLYTGEDFSSSDNTITFALSIRTSTNEVLWDSVLPPMKVRDIPDITKKLVIEKSLTGNTCDLLKIGFIYYIEDVGVSWYWEKVSPGESFKRIEFNFR